MRYRLAAFLGLRRGLGRHAVGDLGAVGVLFDRGAHLLQRRRGFFHTGGLLRGRVRQRLRGLRDLVRGSAELVSRSAHFTDGAAHRVEQRIDLFACHAVKAFSFGDINTHR